MASHSGKNFDRLVGMMVSQGSPLLGAAVLPSVPDPAPAAGRKNTMCTLPVHAARAPIAELLTRVARTQLRPEESVDSRVGGRGTH